MDKFENVGFVIVNYRTPDLTKLCIQNVRRLYPSVAIVVVDNSPVCEQTSSEEWENCIYLPQEANVGFAVAVNLGAKALSGLSGIDLLVFLNPDAEIYDGFLEGLCPLLKNSEIAMVAPTILDNELPPDTWCAGGRFSATLGGVDLTFRGGRIPNFKAFYSEFASGCALLMSLDNFYILGGFDERYFMYEEDLDLSLRVLDIGKKIAIHEDVIVTHIRQGSHQSERYTPPLSVRNPNIKFYLDQIVCNRICNLITNRRLIGTCRTALGLTSFTGRKLTYFIWKRKPSLAIYFTLAAWKGIKLSLTSRRLLNHQLRQH